MDVVCELCDNKNTVLIKSINKKPDVEVDYQIPQDQYYRSIYECRNCGVYFNHHNLISFDTFYSGEYNKSIDESGLLKRFNRIVNLPKEESDNYTRVQRVISYMKKRGMNISGANALDIGSGTCVFLHELKNHINKAYCIDPDPLAISHAKTNVNVEAAHLGSIANFTSDIQFDIITFNKVLEHVNDPIENLRRADHFLANNGRIYIELPEADRIVNEDNIHQRAEFTIEHITIFNEKSLNYLSESAGFMLEEVKTITDPSGKFTIYGFLGRKKK